jgi:hypothetical protein
MPRATVDITSVNHVDLKSCPGGYVELRKLTYGQFLERQSLAMKVTMAMQGRGGAKEGNMEVKSAQFAVACFEMRHCVAAHNLEDDQGRPLDFKSEATVMLLDPLIGQEIGQHIDEMNQLPEDGESGNSSNGSSDASTTPATTHDYQTTTP